MSNQDEALLSSSPAAKSPVKSPGGTPLPPVKDTLQISKRRRLEPSSPLANDPDRITPAKSRSFSTPTRLHTNSGRRTPSLQDRPIPILSPPSNSNANSLSSSPLGSVRNEEEEEDTTTTSPLNGKNAAATATAKRATTTDSEKNAELDIELKNWKKLVYLAQRAGYSKQENHPMRQEAQSAATYLLNQAKSDIPNKLTEDAAQAQLEDELSEEQLEEYEKLKQELVSRCGQDESTEEFTMHDLCKTLNIDYKLLFP